MSACPDSTTPLPLPCPLPACRAMNTIKNLGSTGIYAYTTLISVPICAWGEPVLHLQCHCVHHCAVPLQAPAPVYAGTAAAAAASLRLLRGGLRLPPFAPCPPHPAGIFVYEKGVWEAIKQQVAEKGATQFYGALLRCAQLLAATCMHEQWARASAVGWDLATAAAGLCKPVRS